MRASVPQGRLLLKLLLVSVLGITLVLVMFWLAVDFLAADYFMTLMEKYNIDPKASHSMFLSAVHRYLIWAGIAALILATLLSYLVLRRVLKPLMRMTELSARIAAGDYGDRVPVHSRDEVGRLAQAFNHMAQSLERLEHLRKNLILDVAHELRTPLTNLRGYLEGLLDGVVEPNRETFNLLLEESLRLVRLVDGILELARADAAKMELISSKVDIQQVLAQSLSMVEARLTARDVTVRFNSGPDPCFVKADKDKLSQIMDNLLQNAANYVLEGGNLDIEVQIEDVRARVSLTNTTRNLSQEDLPFIFERFYRAEKSRSRRHGGAGLGLAIAKELVRAQGGEIGAFLENNSFSIWFALPLFPATS